MILHHLLPLASSRLYLLCTLFETVVYNFVHFQPSSSVCVESDDGGVWKRVLQMRVSLKAKIHFVGCFQVLARNEMMVSTVNKNLKRLQLHTIFKWFACSFYSLDSSSLRRGKHQNQRFSSNFLTSYHAIKPIINPNPSKNELKEFHIFVFLSAVVVCVKCILENTCNKNQLPINDCISNINTILRVLHWTE